ncbi:MAG TPA: citrate synthase [Acidobacteriota bacterium]|nr:citrate synthase [Acidobacteriota bacterium]
MPKDTLTIRDNRTGREYELDITDDTIRAIELRQIKVREEEFGMLSYDPGYTNTASCRSSITYIDGAKGILRYRGYPIEQLAERFSFMQVAYLIFNGELPDQQQEAAFLRSIDRHRIVNTSLRRLMESFHHDADPMHMLAAGVAGVGALHPEASDVSDEENRRTQIRRLVSQIPCIAAYAYRHKTGQVFVDPDPSLSYCENFLHMMFGGPGGKDLNPTLVKALDVLFVLHADHEQNCSTATMRSVGSSNPGPYLSAAAAIGALAGPLHGGANTAVLRMLGEIGSKDNIPEYIEQVKAGEVRLMGFGHRVYKNYDPRARIIKKMADEVFQVTGTNPLLEIALELEKIALHEDYFVDRKLYPNVDFYSGLIYQSMGFPSGFFTVLFAIARTVGWLAQWEELMVDGEKRIARPRQVYTGHGKRDV